MMNNSTLKANRPSTLSIGILPVLMILLLGGASHVEAQWTTNGNNLTTTNNVGIGTTSPTKPLEVVASGGEAMRVYRPGYGINWGVNIKFALQDASTAEVDYAGVHGQISSNTTGSHGGNLVFTTAASGALSEKMRIDSAGNVGIGTTTPGFRFDLQGGQINASGGLCIAGDCKTAWSQVGGGGGSQWTTSGSSIYYNSGNVGIGTSNPNAKLVIPSGNVGLGTNDIENWTGASSVIESLNTALFFGQVADIHLISNAYHNAGWKYKSSGPASNYYLYNGTHGFRVAPSGATDTPVTWTDAMTISNSGDVGIGTTTPGFRFDLQGGQVNASGGLCIAGDCKTAWSQVGSSTASAANVSAGQFGQNVGGGNYSFPGNVDIAGAITWGNSNSRTDSKNDAGAAASKSGFFETASPTNYPAGASSWWHLMEARHSNNANNYALQIAGSFFDQNLYMRKTNGNGATAWSKLILQDSNNNVNLPGSGIWNANGNVGIGTTTPDSQYKLDVVGSVRVSGNIAAKYQDLAEWVESSQALLPGTVVVLDHTKSNQVVASSRAYDTRVAGVISLQPGIALGEQGEGKVLVATTGRVRIRVDATRAPIQIGDLLVTGDTEGMAIKSQPINIGGIEIHRPGTLIGKALEPLAKGEGEILVLLSLQ
jgi:hypothetical protein